MISFSTVFILTLTISCSLWLDPMFRLVSIWASLFIVECGWASQEKSPTTSPQLMPSLPFFFRIFFASEDFWNDFYQLYLYLVMISPSFTFFFRIFFCKWRFLERFFTSCTCTCSWYLSLSHDEQKFITTFSITQGTKLKRLQGFNQSMT